MSCSFIISFVTPGRLQKSFDLLFKPWKIHYHHHSACCIVGFLHLCSYTLQHIPENDNFYLVCIQNQSLTQPLHCNPCYIEHIGHENLSLCVFFIFSTCHRRTCLLILLVLLPVFQIDVTQPHSNSFCIESPILFPQIHWMALYRQSFYCIVTRYN